MTGDKRIEERLRGLFESAPDALVIVDASGEIVLVNAKVEKLFGYREEELLGERVEMLVPDRFRERHANQRAGYFADPQTRPMGSELELFGRRKDGSEFPVEVSLSPFETEEGTLVSSAIRDITDRRRAEDKFRDVLESAPDAIVGIGADGRIELVNSQAEHVFGYQREELIGERLESLVPDRFRNAHEVHRDRYFKNPRTRPMGAGLELYGRRKGGTEFPCEILLSTIQGAQGFMAIAAVRDVTERKEAEAEAERLKSEFFALVSHELRTPLASIEGYSELLVDREKPQLSEQARGYLEVIVRNSKRLDRLVEDVLLVAQLESGTFGIEVGEADPQELARHCEEELTPVAEQVDVELLVVAEKAPRFAGDQLRLTQALDNLVSNAIKFTPAGGRVEVRIGLRGEKVVIEVSDTGAGIAPEEIPHLFDRFYRSRETSSNQGAGLGLAILKAIVEKHGGRVEVDSELGSGSTFRIVLPINPPPDPVAEGAATGEAR